MGKSNAVQVKTYKGDNDFQKDAEKMMKAGWTIQGQSSRNRGWKLTTGFIGAGKTITTVTWVKVPEASSDH